ncbi:spore germination protein [Tumebacillus lipolyticus]|uniref:Spore germination protein n=1 Tax=Tumebacillus lipolyticus TaxID=1280370 RepID=A0ABW4ZTA1_9BACL
MNQSNPKLESGDHSTPVSDSFQANERWIRQTFHNCQEVFVQHLKLPSRTSPRSLLFAYCEGLADEERLNQQVIPSIKQLFQTLSVESVDPDLLVKAWQYFSVIKTDRMETTISPIFEGKLVVLIEGVQAVYLLDIAKPPKRDPSEPRTEISIKGPRDGFTEELTDNLALIRKRLKTNSLQTEFFFLGKRSHTRVALLYIEDIANEKTIEDVRTKIDQIDVDAVYSSTQVEEQIVNSKLSMFPQMDYSGRPDYVVDALLKGRFAIMVDTSPIALIAPCNIFLMLKASEDLHNSYVFATFERILRVIGLVVAVLLPGFYVAITSYHQDQIPLSLLATLLIARKGIPLPIPLEAFIMLLLFELFQEAGARLPSKVGQTLAVVGGLIIGDAAIRAGIASPSLLVVAGITAVTTFTLINQSLAGAVSIMRMLIMMVAAFFGLFGFFVAMVTLLIYLANMRSFGIPYLSPISPPDLKSILQSVILLPASKRKRRPRFLNLKDNSSQGEQE